MKEFFFSYGTLQKAEVQKTLFGRILIGSYDALKRYKTTEIEITDVAFLAKGEEKFQQNLIPTNSEGDFVEGTVFEITGEELILSDKYEPDNYKRISVKLESGKNAWIYVSSEKN